MSYKNRELISNMFIQCNFIINRVATPEWEIVSQECPSDNLIFVYGGRGVFTKNGETIEVSEGMLVFFEKGCNRRMESNPKDPIRFYTVNFMHTVPDYENGEWKLYSYPLQFDFVKKINDQTLCERFCRLFEKLCAVHISSAYMRQAREREIMAKILETAMFAYESGTDNYTNKIRTEKVISYMYENYDRKLTLSNLAQKAGVSVSYFTAMFKRVTSESPIDFLISIRIRKAKEMLGSGTDVQSAAERCGFSDIFYFSRLFKKTGTNDADGIHP